MDNRETIISTLEGIINATSKVEAIMKAMIDAEEDNKIPLLSIGGDYARRIRTYVNCINADIEEV